MALDRAKFFAGIRNGPFPGSLSEGAVRGITAILDEWERRGLTDLRWLAYMLATVLAECGKNMLPVREGFAQSDAAARSYVASKHYKYAKVEGGQVYYGRGLVQLTWLANYQKMTDITGVDLVRNPDLALQPDIAAKIMFEGMIRGTFTTKRLTHYFNGATTDWQQARRIINGLDRADEIAGYAKQFYADLMAAQGAPAKVDIPKPAPKPASTASDVGKVAGGGAIVATGAAGVEMGWGATEWIIAALVLAALGAAAYFGWRWWCSRKGGAQIEENHDIPEQNQSDEPVLTSRENQSQESSADTLAQEIANKAKGSLACQAAADEMTKPAVPRRKRTKRKATPAKRAKAKSKKRRAK
jgi:putative chitinase